MKVPLVLLALATVQQTVHANPITDENSLPGTPFSVWGIPADPVYNGYGDPSLQGFTNWISYQPGDTVQFKITAPPSIGGYHLDVYRKGYYGGLGARLVDTVNPTNLSSQPACGYNGATGTTDCSNWSVSATWQVPANSVSGVWFAKLVRNDGSGPGSHVVFVVREDNRASSLQVVLPTMTWYAYNEWGDAGPGTGNSLYGNYPANDIATRAYEVSYDRPLDLAARSASYGAITFFWGDGSADLVAWLEQNGYDVTYTVDEAVDQLGVNSLLPHRAVTFVGHHEYVSLNERQAIESARDQGINLVYLTGNEDYWETRLDGRHLVCYKTSIDGATDHGQWTGTWRDPNRTDSWPFGAPAGYPETALTGQLFLMNADGVNRTINVPQPYASDSLWSGSSVAQAGEVALNLLGYEVDGVAPNSQFTPSTLRLLSFTDVQSASVVQDAAGVTYGPGEFTHAITEYTAPSGAKVFAVGSVWSAIALFTQPDPNFQQLIVNVLANDGVVP